MTALHLVLIVVSLFAVLTALGFFVMLRMIQSVRTKVPPPAELVSLYSNIGSVKKALDGIETDQKDMARVVNEARRTLDNIKTDYDARKRIDDATRESIKRLENIIAGTKAKGMAGENVLREIFKSLPQDMVMHNFKVRGKEVEFGMVLSNKKVVPIDSKWVATDILASMAQEPDEGKREAMALAIEREVLKRINEVAQYIDPATTSSLAIAAVPDAAYTVCKSAHLNAYKRGVVLIPYSMVLPYLLIFFNLHLQFSSTLDVEKMQHYLLDIQSAVDAMDDTLRKKMMRVKTMLENASNDYRLYLSSIKGSIKHIESSNHPNNLSRKSIKA